MEIDNSYENESDANHRKTNEFSWDEPSIIF